jgi:hypothetical protein
MFEKLKWYLHVVLCGLDVDCSALWKRARAFPGFCKESRRFARACDWPVELEPRLSDRDAAAGSLGEYFWQDLHVARRVMELAPNRHIDVGSRIDGFVAIVAATRRVEVLDIRPLHETIPNVVFHRQDITQIPDDWIGTADCVTCLHSIEHFGLGRYGDQIEPGGWQAGLRGLVSLVRANGRLLLSTPVGIERVKFNSHRIFHPSTIADYAATLGMSLVSFCYYGHPYKAGLTIVQSVSPAEDFPVLAGRKYSLGIYEFLKR